MNRFQHVGVVALALLPLLGGCYLPESESQATEPEPAAEPLTSGGSSGTNGLSSDARLIYEPVVEKALTQPLVSSFVGSVVTNPTVINDLFSTPEGKQVFKYTVRCALRTGTVVTYGNDSYTGRGHIRSGFGWLHASLGLDARREVLACLVAHVNPLGIEVPIVLSGAPVADDGLDHSSFNVEEALWLVEVNASGAREYHVWPLPNFEVACKADPEFALKQRVCGQNPAACSLIVRKDRLTACAATSLGPYTCDGKQAIRTTLTTEGFNALYYGVSVCPPM